MILFNPSPCKIDLPCGCQESFPGFLMAGSGDVWQLPKDDLPNPLTYYKQGCCEDMPADILVGGIAPNKKASAQIRVTNITDASVVNICRNCQGRQTSTGTIERGDYNSDSEFIEAIAEAFANMNSINDYTIDVDTISFSWFPDINSCICKSFIYTKHVTDILDITKCPQVVDKQIAYSTLPCFEYIQYDNRYTFNLFDLCVEVLEQPECAAQDEYIQILFPHKFTGCMTIVSDYGCSKPIIVKNTIPNPNPLPFPEYLGTRVACDSVWVQARNKGENWTAFRAEAFPYSPKVKIENSVFKTPKGVNKVLYSTQETVWTFETNYMDYYTHKYLSKTLEKDIVYLEGVFEYGFRSQIKRFTSVGEYDIEWLPKTIQNGRLGKATFTMKEEEYLYVNDYLI